MYGDPKLKLWTFFPGYFPARQFPPYITPGHFPEQTPSPESFPPNTFPVALDDVPFVVRLAQTQFSQKQTRFSGIPSWIFAEPDHHCILTAVMPKWFRRMSSMSAFNAILLVERAEFNIPFDTSFTAAFLSFRFYRNAALSTRGKAGQQMHTRGSIIGEATRINLDLSLIHIWRCRRSTLCRSRWSPYH